MEHEQFLCHNITITPMAFNQFARSLRTSAILHAKKCEARSIFSYGLSSLRIRTRSLFIISSMGLFCFGLWGHLQPFEGILTYNSIHEGINK